MVTEYRKVPFHVVSAMTARSSSVNVLTLRSALQESSVKENAFVFCLAMRFAVVSDAMTPALWYSPTRLSKKMVVLK